MDAWLTNARNVLASAAAVDPAELDLDAEDERTLLDLARLAAHESGERTNAPLLCFLVGRALRGGASLDELADVLRRHPA